MGFTVYSHQLKVAIAMVELVSLLIKDQVLGVRATVKRMSVEATNMAKELRANSSRMSLIDISPVSHQRADLDYKGLQSYL